MLQQPQPDDYVLATGEDHSVREFAEAAFAEVGIRLAWRGQGAEEVGFDAASGRVFVEIDRRYFRPNEVGRLVGDAAKARTQLGGSPRVRFSELVAEMVSEDLAAVAVEPARREA